MKTQREKMELLRDIIDGSVEFRSAYRLGLFCELKKLDAYGVHLKIGDLVTKVMSISSGPPAHSPQ